MHSQRSPCPSALFFLIDAHRNLSFLEAPSLEAFSWGVSGLRIVLRLIAGLFIKILLENSTSYFSSPVEISVFQNSVCKFS